MIRTKLGVNIDHIATIRQARRSVDPDPVEAALLAELGGAHGITVHLRQDRRHIQERDVRLLREVVKTRLNIEMAVLDSMINLAVDLRPDTVTLVPERPDEITTEGGLDVVRFHLEVSKAIEALSSAGIEVSLFIDPSREQTEAAAGTGAGLVEFNTAAYSEAVPKGLKESDLEFRAELQKLSEVATQAAQKGLRVLAGHGLTYRNVRPVSDIAQVEELNIGHNIVSRSTMVGMQSAVRQMLEAMGVL